MKAVNGETSYLETHFEIVDFIITKRNDPNLPDCTVKEVVESQGTGGLWELAEDWADEFEELNKDRDWDGEFYEEIEEFCKTKNKV